MSDKQSAALLIAIAAIAFIIWYRGRSETQRVSLFGGAEVPEGGGMVKESIEPGNKALNPSGTPLERLKAFAGAHGLDITSTTGGQHNPGSMHYEGRAIDVGARGMSDATVQRIREFANSVGIHVFDERSKASTYWTGPHLHLSLPVGGRF